MANDRFFIVRSNDPNLDTILSYCTGTSCSQRGSMDKKDIVVQLKDGDTKNHPELNKYQEHTKAQLKPLLDNDNWRRKDNGLPTI